ncbi:MAG TPA: hypothetical protein VKB05_05845 [Pyrinomonadaceae bacterium]|nr:hypothetical protein [Pyrinomonadaceae bacterium]
MRSAAAATGIGTSNAAIVKIMTIAVICRDEKRAIHLVKVDMNSTPLRLRIRTPRSLKLI